jgi:adenine-specific DNA-methyltransferase
LEVEKLELKAKQRFYNALSNIFIGEVGNKIEGNSGYTNLMNIRNKYFKQILPKIEEKINKVFGSKDKEELYNKLYTFFESYLNETGTPFYNKTQLHKNLYEKVYSDRDDVSLFWKTQKLFYVKSEVLYTSMNFDIEGVIFEFDASNIYHSQNNEKKELVFVLTEISEKNVNFKLYYNDSKGNEIIKEETKENDLKKARVALFENLDNINSSKVIINENSFNKEYFYKNQTEIHKGNVDKGINIFYRQDGLFEKAIVEIGFSKIEDIEDYLKKQNISFNVEFIKKAKSIYRKQNEVDYFISKDADGFLKEQFNIYLYNYLFNDDNTKWTSERIETIQKIKEIAFECIRDIAKFENELKSIWLKPKFVRKSNYVLTLDKLENNIELIKKIINSSGFEKQIEEWNKLYQKEEASNGKEIKKEWKEFEFIKDFDKNLIIKDEEINDKYKFLPIDTRYFKELEGEILDIFENLDNDLDGILIKSDNFQALNTILPKFIERVNTIYIDPPFNTGKDFAYKDGFQDSTWLTLMQNRLELAYEFLKKDGTFFIHLDQQANFMGRILLESMFDNELINEIIWHYNKFAGKTKGFHSNHDTIYYYGKNNSPYFKKIIVDIPEENQRKQTTRVWDSNLKKAVQAKDENGELLYYDQTEKALDDTWMDVPLVNPMAKEQLSNFTTQKPEALIKRIIDSSLEKNEIIMDFFCGSGTTVATAQKMNIKWIGIEMGEHFYTIILPRLKKVLKGDGAGITNDINWKGGGFFKYYELEQYEDVLKNSKYNDKENLPLTMYNSERLANCLKIENDTVKIDFKELYPDVDIAETISNLTGKKIKKINDKRVIFEDNTEIVFDNINWKDNKNLKPLFWWGETNE